MALQPAFWIVPYLLWYRKPFISVDDRRWMLMTKKGEKYKCEECGLVVVVDSACGYSSRDLICCGEPMKPMKGAKAKPKAKK
ncbi:hypothetical protein A3K79_01825 [Candidatus Bathyarchaeota archaeon RBG_13_46_16b]|nr:MAG: hypothetical protein A3K79_01825 [Candidatus Bathyarchaeota archaeon RBG_13_46_16b]